MITETAAQKYYKHENFVAGYYALYVALETWLAANIFRQDMSRIFLASNDYAFRRRFELTDTSVAYDNVAASSLQFPFANYWPGNTGWAPDTRVAANTAALVVSGISHQTRALRAIAVTTTLESAFYFDREDDARLAYEKLLWLSFRERYLYTTIAWKDEQLGLPLNVKVQNLAFNPSFKENDWLQQNRIFTITAEFELRSYSIQPPLQPKYDSNILVEDDEKFTLTEEVILQLKSGKGILGELSIDTLYNQNPSILINRFGLVGSTPTTARFSWDIAVDGVDDAISQIYLTISGRDPVVLAADRIDYTFRKLAENSSYTVTFKILTEKGLSKVVYAQFTTPLSEASTQAAEAAPNSLVGLTW